MERCETQNTDIGGRAAAAAFVQAQNYATRPARAAGFCHTHIGEPSVHRPTAGPAALSLTVQPLGRRFTFEARVSQGRAERGYFWVSIHGLDYTCTMSKRSIYLVGLMAVGKSTVGRQLAKMLDMPFFDADHEIENRTGAEISWIFDVEGEEGFRDREAAVIDELTQQQGIVLATGGGAILREGRHLAARGIVVHWTAQSKN